MFLQSTLTFDQNIFDALAKSANFEHIAKGRSGAVLVDSMDNQIPIVRTTTLYQNRATNFLPIHYQIMDQIKSKFNDLNLQFNNALIEIYDDNYRTMGSHSDQALDLADDSYIGLFSCYDKPTTLRTLCVSNKTSKMTTNISLGNYSVVVFSTLANREHLHKIILESATSNNRWLGITFRLSKTYIKFVNEIPHFTTNNIRLELATEGQRKEFYMHRRLENENIGYDYPEIYYTLSISNTLPLASILN